LLFCSAPWVGTLRARAGADRCRKSPSTRRVARRSSVTSLREKHMGQATSSGIVKGSAASACAQRTASRQATSSGIVERVCGVGLRAKTCVGPRRQAVVISFRASEEHRVEARSADAAEPLHWDAPNPWHLPRRRRNTNSRRHLCGPRSGLAGARMSGGAQPNTRPRFIKRRSP